MTETRVGRLLAACLHQAIGDVLPLRLDFYETWLHSEGLRDGSIGLAPISAVIGFLRTEGEAYDNVMARAGHLAADWTVASLAPVRRKAILWLPRPWRVRAALRLAGTIVHSISRASRTSTRVRGNSARVEVKSSMFCNVRDAQSSPLCTFYVALVLGTLEHFGMPASGRIEGCRALKDASCVLVLSLANTESAVDPPLAA